jgi:hypothetical protein
MSILSRVLAGLVRRRIWSRRPQILVTEVIRSFGCGFWGRRAVTRSWSIDEVFTKPACARYHAGSWGPWGPVSLRGTGPEGSSGGLSGDEPRGGCDGVLSAPDTRVLALMVLPAITFVEEYRRKRRKVRCLACDWRLTFRRVGL